MHSLRFACLLLGMWLAGGFFMAWVATENFHSADRLLTASDPAAMVRLRDLGPGEGRALLRHQVAEQNRDLFETWEFVQLLLGMFFCLFLLLATPEGRDPLGLASFMLLLVLPQRLWLTPVMESLGRTMDFAPNGGSPAAHTRFLVLHGLYVGIELLKWAVGILVGVFLIIRKRKRSGFRRRPAADRSGQ
jgi:hypothetical protein